MEPKRTKVASKVLGILSICLFFTTWPAMVLAIIGLSIKKDPIKEYANVDFTLNIIGLVLSTLWLVYIATLI